MTASPPPAARSEAEQALPGEAAVARAAHASLRGESRGMARVWPFLGPAFIAAVAYIDPGNFATNISGGAKFGYLLLWVVLTANLVAMLVQTQSAKLGEPSHDPHGNPIPGPDLLPPSPPPPPSSPGGTP